ncbi:MAG: hypothetical protein GEV11_18805 [Streptosporangiales bacterium]|nr:hypothetical protein [Streptosporangiales bacterium]
MELTEQHVTRYTVDHNEVPPTDRRWHPSRVVDIERRGPGLGRDEWRITSIGQIYNHETGWWDDDYTYRHTDDEDRDVYFTGLQEAAELAARFPAEWREPE